jgi:two-component system CheB/CheR fusion protein
MSPSRRKKARAKLGPSGRQGPPAAPPFPVVGVGASAGGLEALSGLLKSLPADTRLAVVAVQHLDPKSPSALPQLLGHAGSLPALQAKDAMALAPGHVYVIAPDTQVTVVNGRLKVGRRPTDESQYRPFDELLMSMAAQYRERSIAVVLSGTGSDGARGIETVKAAGGITIAQDPGDARFDGMPMAAIATGAVDIVKRADEIGPELVRICQEPLLLEDSEASGGAEPAPTERGLERIFHLLRASVGIDFSQYKISTVVRRIRRRMMLVRAATMQQYAARLEREPDEIGRLSEDMWIHVTSFFRDPGAYTALRRKVYPRLFKRASDEPIRVWIPGCATGEEVYTVAMELLEFMSARKAKRRLQIFGTDVSHKVIGQARAGVYASSALGDLEEERRRRYFIKDGDVYRVDKRIREVCVFARQDLSRDPPFSNLDLIVCRNVLIYLGFALQRKVIGVFHYALKPAGFLMLGRSETTAGQGHLFEIIDKKHKLYARSAAATVAAPTYFNRGLPESPLRPVQTVERNPRRAASELDPSVETDRLLAEKYGPPGVVLDRDLRVVRAHGDTAPFLQLPRGEPRLDVIRMAREGLAPALRSALHEARTAKVGVRREGVRLHINGRRETVNLDVTPLGREDNRRFLVAFERAGAATPDAGDAAVGGARRKESRSKAGKGAVKLPRAERDHRIAALEKELEESRSYVQPIIQDLETTNEELQAANEEILSSNEELQSANEELDTAREEMQSTNEELTTLNDELQARNDELARVNSDLQNLLASVQIPIVMVSTDLRIRRFTPAAEKIFNLIAADVGRPMAHIRPEFDSGDLTGLMSGAIDTIAVREREVADGEGNAYTLRVRPYKSLDNRIDGAVIALFDISALRMHEARLKVAQEMGAMLMDVVPQPVLLLDRKLKVLRANTTFCDAFGVRTSDTEDRFVYDLGNGQWNIPALRRLLEEVLSQQQNFDDFEVTHDFPTIGRKRMLLDGRRIDAGRNEGVIVLVVKQIHEVGP